MAIGLRIEHTRTGHDEQLLHEHAADLCAPEHERILRQALGIHSR